MSNRFTLLVIADRPPRTPIADTLKQHQIDAIITLGDLALQDIRDLETVTTVPKFGVYGNHDSGSYMPELGITNLHLQTVELGGITLGGFEGSVRYKNDPYAPMYTQEEANELIKQLPAVDLLISHAPPRGIHDEPEPAHQGYDALRWYIQQYHPAFCLHGHTYPSSTVETLAETQIVYIYEDQIVELDFGEKSVRFL